MLAAALRCPSTLAIDCFLPFSMSAARSLAASQMSRSTTLASSALNSLSPASSSSAAAFWLKKAVRISRGVPSSWSIRACVMRESACVLSSPSTEKCSFVNARLVTARSTKNGLPLTRPSTLPDADFTVSLTTSACVAARPPPPSRPPSSLPVSTHSGAIASAVFPAPLESAASSSRLRPTSTCSPRPFSWYSTGAAKGPNPAIRMLSSCSSSCGLAPTPSSPCRIATAAAEASRESSVASAYAWNSGMGPRCSASVMRAAAATGVATTLVARKGEGRGAW
mmetsp:Transcript_40402/g.103446  ORF Transcript_40402/g.103446 Transcript_40402/m.103446 type:complete len:281 (+) Transcript_40402:1863-2705(+)